MINRILTIAAIGLFSATAFAESCQVEIVADDAMTFNKTEIVIGAECTEVELTLRHAGTLPISTMGHAWVLTRTSDFRAVANAGIMARVDNNFVPPGDARVIASTRLVGGGESTSVTFSTSQLEAGGDYTFYCPFPGHNAVMRGKLKFG